MALGTYVNEIRAARRQRSGTDAWGKVIYYYRTVTCPRGKVETELADQLAQGTRIQSTWWDGTLGSATPDDPYLRAVSERKQSGGGRDELTLMYAAVQAGAVSNGYAESRRADSPAYHDRVVRTYGVAVATDSAGIPSEGDVLDGGSGNFDPVCREVQKDDTRFPGIIAILAVWHGSRLFS